VPLTGNKWMTTVKIGGESDSGKFNDALWIPLRSVTPEYFELMGQHVLSGRNFPASHSTETNRAVMPSVAVVNEAMAKRYFPKVNPVLSLSVSSRKREIAIRNALGAQRRDILALVLREGFRLIAVGLLLRAGLAIILARALRTFLFEVQPTDPVTLLGVVILFAAVALPACYLPARRATKVDPMDALRHE